MGLWIHSLGELPVGAERSYYIYLLDYGWDEPLGEVLHKNFDRMAAIASSNDAIVMRGFAGTHFSDEVLSWHSINGHPGDELLPAILITTRHPKTFLDGGSDWRKADPHPEDRMVIIPLRKTCKSSSDVILLIEKLFRDIKEKKSISSFEVVQEMKRGDRGALVDALILQPNISGLGINFNVLINYFQNLKKGA